jgi:hypothetical protein
MVPGYDIEDAECIRETEKALLIKAEHFQKPAFWVPKSVITEDSEITGYLDTGLLCVTEWFAEKAGWM